MAINSLNDKSSNLSSLNQIEKSTKSVNKGFEKLSSGKRINKASDDAAGLAIAKQLESEGASLSQASRNISDAVSQISIADGALQSASDIGTRLSELATQSANGSLSDSQRGALNNEFQSLKSELDRISETTSFNGNKVFGSTTTVQSGTDGTTDSQTELEIKNVSSESLGLGGTDISTQAGAQAAIDKTSEAIKNVSDNRGEIGSVESRLSSAHENNRSQEVNVEEARSRIEDADFAKASSELVAAKIRQSAAVGISASQANLQADITLKLLS